MANENNNIQATTDESQIVLCKHPTPILAV